MSITTNTHSKAPGPSRNMAYTVMGGVLFILGLLTGMVKSLHGVDVHPKVIVQPLGLNLPVQLPPVLRVSRRVGRGISDHHQGALGAWGP